MNNDKPKQELPVNPFEDQKTRISNRKYVRIGVHSGKGGVGKTFLSVNIAYSLADAGYRVGLLDADIDCPNVAKFLGIEGKIATKNQAMTMIEPVLSNGVKIISTALLNPQSEAPIIIRGPIKHNMLVNFLSSTNWGELDYLIIDLPPGTADVPLSAMQLSALDALILITTPTKEAILDTARAKNMAQKLGIQILGFVENMSGSIFGTKSAEIEKRLGIECLGSIELSLEIAQTNEQGEIAFLKIGSLREIREKIKQTIEKEKMKSNIS